MMKSLLLLVIIIPGLNLFAQKPEQLLDKWSSRQPIEKVYLHFDRENYIAGETAWFKAYLSADYLPDTISTTLYTELSDASGKLLTRFSFPVLFGAATGYIEIPDSLSAGNYQVRSYTPTMLNAGTGFTGRQDLFIFGRTSQPKTGPIKSIRLEFFPEGGNLLTGVSNTIAFKATNERGLPAKVNGKIFNEKDQLVTSFETYHDGMGMFEIEPKTGEKYYAKADQDPDAQKFSLPAPTDKAIAVSLIPHPQGYFLELKQKGNDPAFQVAYMIGQMQHHTVFRKELNIQKNEMQSVINTTKLPSGILQVSFFNKNDQPLAERLCFIDNKEYILPGKLVTDTLNFAPKAKNKFSFVLPDTVRGSFSVSVVDAAYDLLPAREQNIYSTLLLTSDLRGYIHNPAYYFSADNDSVKTALDLVMMVNGWRRFKWEELPALVNQTPKYTDPSFITLAGKITLRDTKKGLEEKPVMMMMVTEDSTRSVQLLNTDKQGNFRIDSLLFFGKSRIMFADIRGKKSLYIDAHLNVDTSLRIYSLPGFTLPGRPDMVFMATQSNYVADYEKIYKEKGLLMEEVIVKARKKRSPLEQLEDRYTSGSFSSDSRKVFDLVNTDEAKYYGTVAEYLRAKGFSPGYRSMPSISAMGDFTTEIYLDEFLTDEEILETLSISRVALIKIYSTFSGTWGNGPGGAIAIYTKKGEDLWNSIDAKPATFTYNGYSVTKEYYAPDYTVKAEREKADTRLTLEWRPDIRLSNVNPKVPFSFYNNDRTKKFRVTIEGMTLEGKLLHIEQTIQ